MTDLIPFLHLSVRELVVLLGSVAFLVARWLPPPARRRAVVPAVTMVTAGAVLLLPEIRWQIQTVLAADLLAGLGTGVAYVLLRRRSERRVRWWLALPASLTCLGVVGAGAVAAWALPVPVFPQPSGPSAVGTTVVQWSDLNRAEPATPDPADRRTVVVQLWYPAQPAVSRADRAQYLGRTASEARTVSTSVAGYLGVPSQVLDALPRARTHAVPDAPPAVGRFPVVLFSPGLGGVRTQNTAWAEELASRGYLVVGVDHPYDSAAVVFTDGRTVTTRVAASGDPAEDERRSTGWTQTRADDLRFVLDQLVRMDSAEIAGPFAGRIDTRKVAVTGHSLGGAAAMRAAANDKRFTAVIDLDGGLRPDQQPVGQPVLALAHEVTRPADTRFLAHLSSVLERGTATGYRLTVAGSAHLTFTDAPLYLPPLPFVAGSLGRTGSLRMTAEVCAAFLDATVRGQPVDVPAVLSRYGDLRVYRP